MEKSNELNELIEQLKQNPPKIIGGYKRQGWAQKVLEKISNDAVMVEDDGTLTAMAILQSNDESFYPAFLQLDQKNGGKVIGVYLLAEREEQFDLLPFEAVTGFLGKKEDELLPLKYRTLEKIKEDRYQKNWPDFS